MRKTIILTILTGTVATLSLSGCSGTGAVEPTWEPVYFPEPVPMIAANLDGSNDIPGLSTEDNMTGLSIEETLQVHMGIGVSDLVWSPTEVVGLAHGVCVDLDSHVSLNDAFAPDLSAYGLDAQGKATHTQAMEIIAIAGILYYCDDYYESTANWLRSR